jgi:hypothetical protein
MIAMSEKEEHRLGIMSKVEGQEDESKGWRGRYCGCQRGR